MRMVLWPRSSNGVPSAVHGRSEVGIGRRSDDGKAIAMGEGVTAWILRPKKQVWRRAL